MKGGLRRTYTEWGKNIKGRPEINHSEVKQIYIEGHRGGTFKTPENTMASFRNAIALSADSVELDVWLTKDKQLAVIHGKDNGEISSSTNGNGIVYNLTYSELLNFDAGNGEKIPLLNNVLELCKDRIFVNIEIKPQPSEEVVYEVTNLIKKMNYFNNCAISSFHHPFLELANKLTNGMLEIGYLFEYVPEDMNILYQNGNTINLSFKLITPEISKKIHESGKGVLVWSWGDEEMDYEKILQCDPDILCVNNPQALMYYLLHNGWCIAKSD